MSKKRKAKDVDVDETFEVRAGWVKPVTLPEVLVKAHYLSNLAYRVYTILLFNCENGRGAEFEETSVALDIPESDVMAAKEELMRHGWLVQTGEHSYSIQYGHEHQDTDQHG